MEILGMGGERSVYADRDNPDKLVKKLNENRQESAELSKARFYITKILHELFPGNIPDIHAAYSNPNEVVVERKDLDEGHVASEKYRLWQFSKLNKITDEIHQGAAAHNIRVANSDKHKKLTGDLDSLGLDVDAYPHNFTFDPKGEIIYVDSFDPWRRAGNGIVRSYKLEALESKIMSIENEAVKTRCLGWLSRLEALYKEASEKTN